MQRADIPDKFNVPFGDQAVAPYIHQVPEASQVPFTAGAASLETGFPPLNFSPISAGGVPPFGNDVNGILWQITRWSRWYSAGGPVRYDSTFAAAIGGYPEGAVVQALIPGSAWISTADGNLTDPDAGGAGWSPYGASTGDAKPTLKTTADHGWFIANDGTVGNASSNATTYASAFAEAIFGLVWAGVSNTYAPLLDSAGSPVARGANAAADFAANRAITVPKALGRALIIAGAGSGLTNRVLGQILGEETHLLTTAELAAHLHSATATVGGGTLGGIGTSSVVPGGAQGIPGSPSAITVSVSVANAGGGGAHNNMQPSSAWNFMIKL